MMRILLLSTALLTGLSGHAAAVSAVFGGRVACVPREGVQFCEGSVATRVPTWDGVPLDVNVTLPPAGTSGPFPLIVDLHGWGGSKTGTPFTDRALRGYAVLSYTARGFQGSCGFATTRLPDPTLPDPNACQHGWTHLADARFEGRDTQFLVGLLVDEGLVRPDAIAVTGASYGGGQSIILAALRNRTMLPDGSLVPWTSPAGTPLAIAAAAPLIPWSDLAEALTPAGHTLDYLASNPYGPRIGIQKESWVQALYGVGGTTAYYAPVGVDPDADLTGWNQRLSAGEPYDGDPAAQDIVDEITRHHSGYYIDASIPPAPLFVYNAWTDDLFPADEAIRYWRKVTTLHPGADIVLQLADDFGHPRASLAADKLARVLNSAEAFLDEHLLGGGSPLPRVRAWTQACNGSSESGAFVADTWDALHPGEVRFASDEAQQFDWRGGDPAVAAFLNPLSGGPCRVLPATDERNVATYRLPVVAGAGYTLLGAPTVIAQLHVSGSFAQVAARLWDVAPDGTQALVTHLLYRPRADNAGPQVFQLHPSGWVFLPGHRPKLELLGQDPPYGRHAGGQYVVTVDSLELRLPVAEAPDGVVVLAPAAPVMPPAAVDPPDTGPLACTAAPRSGCETARSASIEMRDATRDARDAFALQLAGGDAAFGDATGTAAYRLCLYAGGGTLVGELAAPAGGRCHLHGFPIDCWSARGDVLRYTDADGTRAGLSSVVLRSSRQGDARITVRGRGPALALPPLPLALPLRAQFVGNRGVCWEATFTAPAHQNASGRFRATLP